MDDELQRKVLFVSENNLDRAENLKAVFMAYGGEKSFTRGWESYVKAPSLGYPAVVVDTMPPYMPDKGDCKVVFIGHGIPGGKLYGFDQPRGYVDERVRGQVDYAVCSSEETRGIVSGQTGAPMENTLPLGMPRTDALVGKRKGDGETLLGRYRRAYLYLPTFRDGYENAPFPNVNWSLVGTLLEEGEVLAVKRHYYTDMPILDGAYDNVIEIGNQEPTTPCLVDCDAVLTDFSSVSIDALAAGKPLVLATDGSKGYMANRGMYFDYPSDYATRWMEIGGNERKMVEKLRTAADEGQTECDMELAHTFCASCDGRSAARVAELIGRLV